MLLAICLRSCKERSLTPISLAKSSVVLIFSVVGAMVAPTTPFFDASVKGEMISPFFDAVKGAPSAPFFDAQGLQWF